MFVADEKLADFASDEDVGQEGEDEDVDMSEAPVEDDNSPVEDEAAGHDRDNAKTAGENKPEKTDKETNKTEEEDKEQVRCLLISNTEKKVIRNLKRIVNAMLYETLNLQYLYLLEFIVCDTKQNSIGLAHKKL